MGSEKENVQKASLSSKEKSAESEEVTSAQQDLDNTEVVVALIQAPQPQPNRAGGQNTNKTDQKLSGATKVAPSRRSLSE